MTHQEDTPARPEEPDPSENSGGLRASWPRHVLRLAVILLIAYCVHLLMDWVLTRAEAMGPSIGATMMMGVVVAVLLAYAVLIAVPFVPGIEIGISLMVIRGADVAPYVYLATVAGLLIAYFAGRFLPYDWLKRLFSDLGLRRAAQLLERTGPLSKEERLGVLRDGLPRWARALIVDWRHCSLMILLNLPGNVLLGGGGGICFVAGLSRIFSTRGAVLSIALAVLPVPLLVWIFGVELTTWFR